MTQMLTRQLKRKHFLTFIDYSNITRLKQFHEKSIHNKIDGRELVLGQWTGF